MQLGGNSSAMVHLVPLASYIGETLELHQTLSQNRVLAIAFCSWDNIDGCRLNVHSRFEHW